MRAPACTRDRARSSPGSPAGAPTTRAARTPARPAPSRPAPGPWVRRAPSRAAAGAPASRRRPARCRSPLCRSRHSRPCTVALPDFHVTARGSTRPVASNPPTGPRAITRRPDPLAASTTTCGGVTPPERTHTMPPAPQSSPRCQPSRQLARRAVPGRGDHEPAEAVFVAAPRQLAAVGRPRVRTLARTPTPARRARLCSASTGARVVGPVAATRRPRARASPPRRR